MHRRPEVIQPRLRSAGADRRVARSGLPEFHEPPEITRIRRRHDREYREAGADTSGFDTGLTLRDWYVRQTEPIATTPRRSAVTAAPAVSATTPPATMATWSSRSTACRHHRTKSPAVTSVPPATATVIASVNEPPLAQADSAAANPRSGSRVAGRPKSLSCEVISDHTRIVAAIASAAAVLRGWAVRPAPGESRRDSKTSADTTAASSAGSSPSHSPRRRHSATTRSLSDQILDSVRPAGVSLSPMT